MVLQMFCRKAKSAKKSTSSQKEEVCYYRGENVCAVVADGDTIMDVPFGDTNFVILDLQTVFWGEGGLQS